ncbi:MAG: hypothetical protein AAF310_00665 [Myxococcota bacterium]
MKLDDLRQQLDELSDRAIAVFEQLDSKQRRLVILGSAAGVLLLFVGGLYAMSSMGEAKQGEAQSYRDQIRQIVSLRLPYRKAQVTKQQVDRQLRTSTISLFSFLPAVAGQLGLALSDLDERTQKVPDSSVTKRSVSITLKKLSIDKLTSFMEVVEDGGGPARLIRVTDLKVTRRADTNLDAQLTVATWSSS